MSGCTVRDIFHILIVTSNLFWGIIAEEISSSTNFHNTSTNTTATVTSPETPHLPQEVGDTTNSSPLSNMVYIILITVFSLIGVTALIAAGICWYRHTNLSLAAERVFYRSSDSSVLIHNGGHIAVNELGGSGAHQLSSLAKRSDYPAYGVTGPNPLHNGSYEPPVDGVLNKNAEMYHYNQTKKRIKSLSSSPPSESSSSSKNFDSPDAAAELDANDEETSDGEYTVYECSGFAATMSGPMEVHNPLFADMMDTNTSNNFSLQNSDNGFHMNHSYIASSAQK